VAVVFCRVLEVIDGGFGIEVKLRDKQRDKHVLAREPVNSIYSIFVLGQSGLNFL
jgi:hypothetical protein